MTYKTKKLGKALCSSFLAVAAGTVAVGSAAASIYAPQDLAALWLAATVSGVASGAFSVDAVDEWKAYKREP